MGHNNSSMQKCSNNSKCGQPMTFQQFQATPGQYCHQNNKNRSHRSNKRSKPQTNLQCVFVGPYCYYLAMPCPPPPKMQQCCTLVQQCRTFCY